MKNLLGIPIPSKFFINPFGGHSLCTRPNVVYSSIKLRKIKFFPESRRIHKIKSEDLRKFVQTPFFMIISAQLLANDVVDVSLAARKYFHSWCINQNHMNIV